MLRSRSNTLKTNKSGVDMIFVLTVFVLFVCCLRRRGALPAYKHFRQIEKRFDTATAQTLVLQARIAGSGAVSVGSREIRIISALDTMNSESYATTIYCYDGGQELFVESSAPFVAENGNTLFPADNFTATADKNTIDFTITCNGVQTSLHYCLRSGKEGAG